jgi:hypothetical protein
VPDGLYLTGVDLAARFSAAVQLDVYGKVIRQWDSASCKDENDFLEQVIHSDGLILVEDLPQGLSRFDSVMKHVVRMQGRIIEKLYPSNLHRLLFISPGVWQRHYPDVFRQKPAVYAKFALDNYAYVAPNVLQQHLDNGTIPEHGPERQKARLAAKKIMTDYTDAFLIAMWAIEVLRADPSHDVKHVLLSINGVQDYG